MPPRTSTAPHGGTTHPAVAPTTISEKNLMFARSCREMNDIHKSRSSGRPRNRAMMRIGDNTAGLCSPPRREARLLARDAGHIDGVLIHEGARRRITFAACSVGFTGTFDPQVGVGVRAPGYRGRRRAQCSATGVAPVEPGVGRWSGAVARRVDHVVRTVGERRNRLAITDFVAGGEEVRSVDAETPRVPDTDLVEPGGHVLGAMPAQVPTVELTGRGWIARQRVDGVANQVEAFLALVSRQAVGHGEGIGFEDDRRPRSAHAGCDAVDP